MKKFDPALFSRYIIEKATAQNVQDIYILPCHSGYELYFRDFSGRKFLQKFDKERAQAVIAHFKFLSGMNVGERRRTQLGATSYPLGDNNSRRLRLSTVGDFTGKESLVIRLLHDKNQPLQFWQDEAEDFENLQDIVKRRGLHLFSGSVGSGKTTLMYHLARQQFSGQQVICIEDPIELVEKDFLQLQLNETIGNDYDELIKLSLRHRPDLVIVGEIRDSKTARAVLRASLAGYTVFSTIHARSISGVMMRLQDLGLSAWEIKNSLQSVTYQRLIGGKGVIESAEKDFESHGAERWNAKIEKLFADGHLSDDLAQAEKIKSE